MVGSSNKPKKQRILVILKKIEAKGSGRRASGQKAGIWEFKIKHLNINLYSVIKCFATRNREKKNFYKICN